MGRLSYSSKVKSAWLMMHHACSYHDMNFYVKTAKNIEAIITMLSDAIRARTEGTIMVIVHAVRFYAP